MKVRYDKLWRLMKDNKMKKKRSCKGSGNITEYYDQVEPGSCGFNGCYASLMQNISL